MAQLSITTCPNGRTSSPNAHRCRSHAVSSTASPGSPFNHPPGTPPTMETTVHRRAWWPIIAFLFLGIALPFGRAATVPDRLELSDGWFLQSSRQISASPEILSSTAFVPQDWRETKVPTTVLAAQVARGEFKNIFYADN